jgi:hypothetical protein
VRICQNRDTPVYESYVPEVTVAQGSKAAELVNNRGLNELFRDRGIDALVCRSGVNVTYLSGIATPGTRGRHLDLAVTGRPSWCGGRRVRLLSSSVHFDLEELTWAA